MGGYMAKYLFDEYRGKWEVGFHPKNTASEKFWLSVVADYTGGDYTLNRECPNLKYNDGSLGNIISFDSRHR